MKRKKDIIKTLLTVLLVSLMSIGILGGNTTLANEINGVKTDASTQDTWSGFAKNSTEYIGRIWTDKSVSEDSFQLTGSFNETITKNDADSDFLVMLSALSTASSTSTTSSKPLDIVLVLDVSGSMEDNIYESVITYNEYNPNSVQTAHNSVDSLYYSADGTDYIKVNIYRSGYRRYTISANGLPTVYNLNAYDPIPAPYSGHLYMREEQIIEGTTQPKIDALKEAVKNFIDLTAEANNSMPEGDGHRISVVKFADDSFYREATLWWGEWVYGDEDKYHIGNDRYKDGYAYNFTQVMRDFTDIKGTDVDELKQTIDDIDPAGATSADYGLELADDLIKGDGSFAGARDNAQKVVIFFTDGEPNHSNNFDNTVANAAISKANSMKESGAVIYTIGVFSGADPNDVSDGEFNTYMNAVSSNYPDAQSLSNLGNRADDADDKAYYKAASGSASLEQVFSDIFSQINLGSGSPTYVEEGAEDTSGYITFYDQLGKYMHVTGFNSIVYANQRFTQVSKSGEGNVDTYVFTGKVGGNEIYGEADLNNIIIQVDKTNPAQEMVTVKIPASLIPLRYFDVKNDNNQLSMEVREVYPIRIFYEIALDDNVRTSVANGTFGLNDLAYLTNNTNSDGEVLFYANEFDRESREYGSVYSDFTPSTSNQFYYFTSNTPLYLSTNENNPATGTISSNTTYYYKQYYYEISDGVAVRSEKWVKATNLNPNTGVQIDGQLYVRSGTRKNLQDYGNANIELVKTSNTTNTANYVISPTWNDSNINARLGNNGAIPLDVPGSLSVSKTVKIADGFENAYAGHENDSFTFVLKLNGSTKDSYQANKTEDSGTTAIITLNKESDGTYKFTLKDGESIEILGLEDGVGYSLTEEDTPNYKEGTISNSTGTIVSATESTASVTNTFKVDPTTLPVDHELDVRKLFTGRDTTTDDVFEFSIRLNASLPTENSDGVRFVDGESSRDLVSITMTDTTYDGSNPIVSSDASFGDIKFSKPGTYIFAIRENVPTDRKPGVDYSNETYYMVVKVVVAPQNSDLQVEDISYFKGDLSTSYDYALKGAFEFTNTYDADNATFNLVGRKQLNVTNSNKTLSANDFKFKITAVKVDGTTYTTDDKIAANKIPMPVLNGQTVKIGQLVGNGTDTLIDFGTITFKNYTVNKEYTYVIEEEAPAADTNGYSYDRSAKELTIKVTDDSTDGVVHLVASPTNDLDPSPDRPNSWFLFTNSYEPSPYTTTGNDLLRVDKTLSGRNWHNDSFEFELTGLNGAPVPTNNTVTISGTNESDGTTLNTSFGAITYERAGTYNYEIREAKGNNNGITYDSHVVRVQVIVEDDNGSLKVVSTSYDNDTSATASAKFVNTYRASGTGTITVQKNIDGRDFIETDNKDTGKGAFVFTLAAKTDYGTNVTMPSGLVKNITFYDDEDSELLSDNQRRDTFDPITFNKPGTYTFTVQESNGSIPGITYDTTVKEVTFVVEDNYDGTLKVTVSGDTDNNALVQVTNTYEPEDVTTSGNTLINVQKTINGRDWLNGEEFEFRIEAADSTPDAPLPASQEVTVSKDDQARTNTGSFGSITYTEAGEYKYSVTEVTGSTAGLKYSLGEYEVIVNVIDDQEEGKLVIESITYNVVKDIDGKTTFIGNTGIARFTNTYRASQNYELKVHKDLNGRGDWLTTDSFDFTLSAGNSATVAAVESGDVVLHSDRLTISSTTTDKTASFGNITFNKTGNYSFIVTEVNGGLASIEYAQPQTVNFTVTDENYNGVLTVVAKVGTSDVQNNTLTFVNTYTADAVSAVINVDKTVNGKNWANGDSFTFTLAADSSDNLTSAAVTNGDVVLPDNKQVTIAYNTEGNYVSSFGEITFNKEGTYKFTVTENDLSNTNWSNTDPVKTVTIVVEDNDQGQLVLQNAVNGSYYLSFTNLFTPDPVSVNIKGTKTMTGRELEATDVFDFTLTAVDGAPMPDGSVMTSKTVQNNLSVIDFGNIAYDQAGVYNYQITEELIDDENGVTSDSTTINVTVTVTYDPNTGILSPEITYSKQDANGGFQFTNVYEADPVQLGVDLNGQKTITNTDVENQFVLGAGDFSFSLVPSQDNDDSTDPLTNGRQVSNNENGSFIVIPKETKYSAVGEYVYYLTEDNTTINGIRKDTAQYTITVTVSDDGHDGQLDADIKVEKAGVEVNLDDILFNNTFDAAKVSPAQIEATKTLNGKELTDGEFEFELSTSAEDAYTIAGADDEGKVVVKNTAASNSNIKFPTITFDKAGTYRYSIKELDTAKAGYIYDETEYVITYLVELNGETNMLEVDCTVTSNGEEVDAIVFENTYDPEDVVLSEDTDNAITAHKTLDGRELQAGEFTFGLYRIDGAAETLIEEVQNDENGNVIFSDLVFDTVGTYNFVIKEKGAGSTNNGISYDKDPVSVVVTVTDEGFDGQLDAEVVYDTDTNTAEFVNVYSASSVTDLALPVRKELANRELAEGEFTFELYLDGKLIETVTNDANGDVRFSGLSFDQANETVVYTVKEVKGNDKTITYDSSEYEIQVSVVDNLKGQLEAKVEVLNDEDGDNVATFHNTYTKPDILVPDTASGDNQTMICLSLSAAVTCAIAIVVVIKKKEKLDR